jgi:hypothetical protein
VWTFHAIFHGHCRDAAGASPAARAPKIIAGLLPRRHNGNMPATSMQHRVFTGR